MRENKRERQKLILSSTLVGIVVASWCCQLLARQLLVPVSISNQPSISPPVLEPIKTRHNITIKTLGAKNLNPKVLDLAMTAYLNAKKANHGKKDLLTIVDYSLSSTVPRMWVIDLKHNKVIHHTHVAHGLGSGDKYANKFSNQPGSLMSSLGLFLTGSIYHGHYGTSLNLHGLEEKFNSNALSRRIVMHKANYVDEKVINKIGRLGRSFGCLALNNKVADEIMHNIKGGSLVFCYYPDAVWLSESKMLST